MLLAGAASADVAQLRAMLEAAGHCCLLAAQAGWEALATLTRVVVDVVVQELACPGARRLEAVKTLRGWPPPLSRLPVVVLAAQQERGLESACLEAGFDALLSRPAAAEALEAVLRRVVIAGTPPEPLDRARREALLAELGPERRRAQGFRGTGGSRRRGRNPAFRAGPAGCAGGRAAGGAGSPHRSARSPPPPPPGRWRQRPPAGRCCCRR